MKKKFICTVCGYIHEGTEAPAECPVCHVKAEKFNEFKPAALKGTKTEANLMAAFAGESQAHTKYQYYASKARKDGYQQIADIFMETSRNEKNTPKFGSNSSTKAIFLPQPTTFPTQQRARTTNGPTCMRRWPRKPSKRDSLRLQ